ncbi:MAG: TldD/PmbA family protein [Thermoleophilaceae bacterium]
MRELLADLMDAAAHADYADARFVATRAERIATRNGELDELERSEQEGIGVRVRVDGAWGFAATRETTRPAAEAALERALAVAEATAGAGGGRGGAPLTAEPRATGYHETPFETDPFEVPTADKLAVLAAADAELRGEAGVTLATAHFAAYGEQKLFASTEGALCEQRTTECGGGLSATVATDQETQVRSYPGSHEGGVEQAGYEHFERLDLPAHAGRVAAEAAELARAPACPPGTTTLILAGEQLALQLHESVGHAVELDRVLGREASYAGTSFVAPEDAGSLRYGSGAMNVTADATSPGGLGTFAWDDEGVAARAEPIVRDGLLRGFLSSRETASEIGRERSAGCMRAEGFARQPVVRMTNVNLEAGDAGSLEDLIAATERGLLMDTNRSWSIDSRRLQFQFAAEAAWEIEDGRRGRLLRNPSYAGVTPEFWGRLDAVCSAPEWRLWSVLNCGKGEPGQAMHVSHGVAPARFRDVEVGVA